MFKLTDDQRIKIIGAIQQSGIGNYNFPDKRGRAPSHYLHEIGYAFAIDLQNPGPVIEAPVVVDDVHDKTDLLSWYYSKLANIGAEKDSNLIQLYTILVGLGMRESSGDFCCGIDDTAVLKLSGNTAECGPFQVSYGACINLAHKAVLGPLFDEYRGRSDVQCKTKNVGSADAIEFQRLSKECPEFACRFAVRLMRLSGGYDGEWGPIDKRKAEARPEALAMMRGIAKVMS